MSLTIATDANGIEKFVSSAMMSLRGGMVHAWVGGLLLVFIPTLVIDTTATKLTETTQSTTKELTVTTDLTRGAATPTTSSRVACLSSTVTNTTSIHTKRCQRKRTKLIRRYHKYLSNARRRIHICKEIKKRRDCLPRAGDTCVTYSGELRHWQNFVNFLNCDCDKDKGECTDKRRCFENAFHSPLGRACSDLYDFNIRQNTQDKCFFLAEGLRCKQAVLDSACGTQAALASFDIINLARASSDARKCQLKNETTHDRGFRYSVDCPPDFAEPIESCNSRHLTRHHHLLFYDTLELVAVGNKTNLQKACQAYGEYKRCVSGVQETCPDQTRIVYDADDNLRTYTAKMEFLCGGEGRSVYMDKLHCFIGVVRNVSILPCQLAWDEAQNVLHTITAHEYFCLPDSNSTASRTVRGHLNKVRECYVTAFATSCGSNTRHVMSKSLDLAFADPYYLHMGRRPDCDLHAGRIPARRPANMRKTKQTENSRASSDAIKPEVKRRYVTGLLLGALLLSISRSA